MIPAACDLLIVGAGPAATALALTQPSGRRVVIVERRRAPWRKPCDGILTPSSCAVLERVAPGVLTELQPQTARALRLIDRDGTTETDLPLAGHVMVDRQSLDTALRSRAESAPNTLVLDETEVVAWTEVGDELLVTVRRLGRESRIVAAALVDASGARAISRRLHAAPLPTAIGVQVWYVPQADSARCEWIFDSRETPYYLWAIHKRAGLLLGGVFPTPLVKRAREAIESRLVAALDVVGTPTRVQVARMAMPADRHDIQTVVGGALVVGEAAGLVNAGTGEGISFALRSGYLCGCALASSASRRDAMRAYQTAVAPLEEEAWLKACHARTLFVPRERRQVPDDRVLVPVPRVPLELRP